MPSRVGKEYFKPIFMTKKKFFFASGAILMLAIAAFADKVSSRRNPATSVYYVGPSGVCFELMWGFTTTKIITTSGLGETCQLTIVTSINCTKVGCFSSSLCHHKA